MNAILAGTYSFYPGKAHARSAIFPATGAHPPQAMAVWSATLQISDTSQILSAFP